MTRVLLALIAGYRRFVSPIVPPACRFEPSCSRFASEAIAKHGPLRGIVLSVARVCRCAPWHPGGFDPVP
jgi:putative membrane protein insertion efficiency factor